MHCPRCGATGIDAQGFCVGCRLFRGVQAPPAARNPLLIPGLIFGAVALLLVAAVIVYAATGGDDDSPIAAASTSQSAVASPAASPTAPSARPGDSASAGPSASGSPSPSADQLEACLRGVWLEERHDETVTVLNTGVFPFHGSGTYQRYNDSGRVFFDYGSGVHLTGSNGSTTYDFVFTGFIVYTYRVENGMVTYSNPRPDGTETFFRNGHQDYTSKLEARIPSPKKINCGPVAMSLTGSDATIELKRTSAPA